MGGETKRRISDLEIELNEARNKNKLLMKVLGDQPTLRDQFAMATLTGLLSDAHEVIPYEDMPKKAYEIADAMMEARNNE